MDKTISQACESMKEPSTRYLCPRQWKASRYNFIVERQDGTYLFNGLRGSLLRVDDRSRKTLLGLLKCGCILTDKEMRGAVGNQAAAALRRGGFVVRSDFDELEYIRLRNNASRFASTGLSLAVCPTMDCNFRCIYCYQSDRRQVWRRVVMSEQTARSLLRWIKRSAHSVRHVAVVWYGGEPTLGMDIISMITSELKQILGETKTLYSASMITNGYKLTDEIQDALVRLGISRIQVTLDGPREIHDKRRRHISGRGTFDQIIENVGNLASRMRVSIRINVDRDNLATIPSLLSYLATIGLSRPCVEISIARVLPPSEVCLSAANRCFSCDEFSRHELELMRVAWRLGFKVGGLLRPALSACGACGVNCYTVDPQGWVYNCWEEVGKRQLASGHITRTGELRVNMVNQLRWTSIDPTRSRRCSECKYLPLCMGGCLYRSFSDEEKQFECTKVKFNIEERIRLYVDILNGRIRSRCGERR